MSELDYKENWVLKSWWIWTMVMEKPLVNPLDCKEIQPANPRGNHLWIFSGSTDPEAEAPILWPPDVNNWLIGRDPGAGKSWRQQDKGTTADVMVGWHDQLDGYEFEQAPEVGDGTRKPGMLPSVGSQRVRHDWVLNWTETDIKRLAKKEWGGILSAPFWCLCQKLSVALGSWQQTLTMSGARVETEVHAGQSVGTK